MLRGKTGASETHKKVWKSCLSGGNGGRRWKTFLEGGTLKSKKRKRKLALQKPQEFQVLTARPLQETQLEVLWA